MRYGTYCWYCLVGWDKYNSEYIWMSKEFGSDNFVHTLFQECTSVPIILREYVSIYILRKNIFSFTK